MCVIIYPLSSIKFKIYVRENLNGVSIAVQQHSYVYKQRRLKDDVKI